MGSGDSIAVRRFPRMTALVYPDHRADPAAWARALGVSREAVELYLASDVIDLHVDSFIWSRILRYDLAKRHGLGPTRGWFLSQVDLPRVREAQLGGAIWVITTNPIGPAERRGEAFFANLTRLQKALGEVPEDVAIVRTAAEYRAARAVGKHGAFIGIQGGNALDASLDLVDRLPDDLVLRVTLVHLSSSKIGTTSSPLAVAGDGRDGLTDFGRAFVERLEAKNVFADLAHISRRGFFDAVEVHDKTKPLLVTHTGVAGVTPHWRNLDDEQLRAVADSGGTVGIMFQSTFLGDGLFSGKCASVVDHLAHIVRTVGEDHASIGSDFDGAIVPPRDLRSPLELPRLVDHMLRRGWAETRIRKILGGNFLRTVAAVRG